MWDFMANLSQTGVDKFYYDQNKKNACGILKGF